MQNNIPRLNREEFNVFIENIPISEENKQLAKETAKLIYDFDDFLCKKFNTSSFAANAILNTNIEIMVKKRMEENSDLINTEEELFSLLTEITSEYAKSVGFPEYEKVGKSTFDIINALKKSI
jgi:replication-associated recombination protein RarA